ncbi:M4 family metallopeptidase [Bdellovibrionota bacterium FG-1]
MLISHTRASSYLKTAVLTTLTLTIITLPSIGFAADSFSHLPQVISTENSFDSSEQVYQSVRQDPVVREFLTDNSPNALSLSSKARGYGVETTKFQHYYKGLLVMGSMTFHHASSEGAQVTPFLRRFDLDVSPSITAENAVAIAKAVAGDRELSRTPELKILPSSQDDSARLIYWVDMANQGFNAGADVLIDAHTGQLVASLSKMETIAPVQIMTAKQQGIAFLPITQKNDQTGKYEPKGCKVTDMAKANDPGKMLTPTQCKTALNTDTPLTQNQCQVVLLDSATSGDPLGVDPTSCSQVVKNSVPSGKADAAAKNALKNSVAVLNYYKDVHGRNGIDDQGAEVVSIVHVGLSYANAAWISGMDFMMYGDGDGELMDDMTKGLDVAGHEITHGITSKTAKLERMDQSGALNEANSDFFGKMIAQDGTWMLGASLSKDLSKFPGIRDISNPGVLKDRTHDGNGDLVEIPYPSKVSEALKKRDDSTVCDRNNDYCWVHFNSTVASHAAYLVHQAIGKSKAEAIYYLTLTQFLPSNANFKTAAQAVTNACTELSKQGRVTSDDCDQVRKALTDTEML